MISKTPKNLQKDVSRYYRLIHLYLGLKLYIDNHEDTDFDFIGSEIKIKRDDGRELKPDIILQYASENEVGFPVEVKRSLSCKDDVKDELEKMTRYDEKLIGWDTEDREVKDHKIVFAPNLSDSQRVIDVYEDSEEINFEEKEFLIWEWAIQESMKYDEEEALFIRNRLDNLDLNDKLADYLNEGLRIDLNNEEFLKAKDKTLFVRQRPPIPYTIEILWHSVLRGMNKDDYVYTISEVKEEIQSKYTANLMQNVDGNPFQVRKDWLRDAFNSMVELNLAEKLSQDEYKVELEKEIQKDFQDYITNKLGEKIDEDQARLS